VLHRAPDLTLSTRPQVVALLRDALAAAGLDLYLAPYGVLPTDYECGVIEVGPSLGGPEPGTWLRDALVPVRSSRADATGACRAQRCVWRAVRAVLCPCTVTSCILSSCSGAVKTQQTQTLVRAAGVLAAH